MDGRGSVASDSVFVERLWRSVRYEEVYLRAYDSVAEARGSIGGYFAFYNRKRPPSSLDGRTPDQAYFCGLALAGCMMFAAAVGHQPVGLRPPWRPTASNGDSSQGNHLSEPKRCSDQPGHLSLRCRHSASTAVSSERQSKS